MSPIRIRCFAALTAASSILAMSIPAHGVLFDNRQNVNIMNSYAVSLSAEQTVIFPGIAPNNLRAAYIDDAFWDGGSNPPGGTNALTINFGESRNLETIRTLNFSGFGLTSATVETSTDGVIYAPQAATFTNGVIQDNIGLNAPVNAQYLRLRGTGFDDGAQRWVVKALRVFGSAGTLSDGSTIGKIDLVSGTGFNESLALTLNSASMTDTTTSEFINDALNPIKRQVIFSMGAGDGFTVQLNEAYTIDRIGFNAEAFHTDAGSTFRIETSLDGVNFVTALQTGVLVNMNYYSFLPKEAQYVRFSYVTAPGGDNRIGDFQVFQGPEPGSIGVLSALVGFGLLRRTRCTRRRI